MMIRILDRENDTLLNKFIAQMRDVGVQGDSMRFRRNLERTGEVMAYEISKTLHYSMRTRRRWARRKSRCRTIRSSSRRSCAPVCPFIRAS